MVCATIWPTGRSIVSRSIRAAFYRLQASGRIYPCYETETELERQRSLLAARKLPPIYNRGALEPANEEEMGSGGQEAPLALPALTPEGRVDRPGAGAVEIDTATMSDPVVVREDGGFLYTLPSVADDVDFAISHVVRGEDHVTNTAAQIEIFEALGAKVPAFAHFPLLVGAGGEALSKRLGSLSLQQLREEGMEPLARGVLSRQDRHLRSGRAAPVAGRIWPPSSTSPKSAGRRPISCRKSSPLNAKLLHILPYSAVKARVQEGEAFWDAIKPNIAELSDVPEMARLIHGPVTPVIEDAGLAEKAASLLPPEPWNDETWGVWTKAVTAETGAKGRACSIPLRLALTGLEHGPELKKLLPLIGRDRCFGAA